MSYISQTLNKAIVQQRIRDLLSEWMPGESIDVLDKTAYSSMPYDDMKRISYGLKLKVGDRLLYIHWKYTSSSAEILHAIHFLKSDREGFIPIIAVPFMGPTGKKLCEQERINWMDLSGNANIRASSPTPLLVSVSGKPNKFITRGRKSSVFAPKSSRVIRWLLMNSRQPFTSRILVHETEVDAGHCSRILERLEESHYITRRREADYVLENPQLLLADWRSSYDFFRQNEIIRGHIPARSSEELIERIATCLKHEADCRFAFTGLAAAWQYTQWVTYRLVTSYIDNHLDKNVLGVLEFEEGIRGANVWFVIPKDEGVFMGKENPLGIPCVSRIQAYLDLKEQPERSDEAAEELYKTLGLGSKYGRN